MHPFDKNKAGNRGKDKKWTHLRSPARQNTVLLTWIQSINPRPFQNSNYDAKVVLRPRYRHYQVYPLPLPNRFGPFRQEFIRLKLSLKKFI